MLEKESGHLVSPVDNRDNSSLNLHPKETDDVLAKYNILFPFPASPNYPPACIFRRPEGLLEIRPRQAIPSHLPYLRKASRWNSQSGESLDSRPGLWSSPPLDTLSLPKAIFELCKIMTVQEVVRHLGLNWKTVKAIDQKFLEELLQLNKVINTVLILKYKLKHIWTYRSRRWAEKAIEEWCGLAPDS